jgi:hypothetical protein
MILNNAINAGGFIYCAAYFGPHEDYTYFNDGSGHHHQYSYIVEGSAIIQMRKTLDGEVVYYNDNDVPGTLFEHSDYKNMHHSITTKDRSLSIINFNPIPDTRILDIEIIKGPAIKAITSTDKRVTIVCITGPITANDKTLASLQHAKIFPGKTAELNLPESTVCALVSDK